MSIEATQLALAKGWKQSPFEDFAIRDEERQLILRQELVSGQFTLRCTRATVEYATLFDISPTSRGLVSCPFDVD
jgi:hypothetical protein